jgi:hypothetical protein
MHLLVDHCCAVQALGTEVRTFTGGEISATTAVLVAAAVLLVCDLLGGMRAVAYTGALAGLSSCTVLFDGGGAAECGAVHRHCHLPGGAEHALPVLSLPQLRMLSALCCRLADVLQGVVLFIGSIIFRLCRACCHL